MSINKNELTKEQIQKAMACKTAEELMALAKAEGIELTKEAVYAIWLPAMTIALLKLPPY